MEDGGGLDGGVVDGALAGAAAALHGGRGERRRGLKRPGWYRDASGRGRGKRSAIGGRGASLGIGVSEWLKRDAAMEVESVHAEWSGPLMDTTFCPLILKFISKESESKSADILALRRRICGD
jgi:hypothetical protein